MLRLRESVGPMPFINARDGGSEVDEIFLAGLDLDEGMVLHLGANLYHGEDCIHALALLSGSHSFFNRVNGWVFRSKLRSRWLYPILRAGRNAALFLLGRKKITLQK